MRIPYQYPVLHPEEDAPEDAFVEYEEGGITIIRLDTEPYECIVEALGYSFHILFGSQINGNFLCIPNWNIGCELASLDDLRWNLNSLLNTDHLDYEESTAIIYAVAAINGMIQERAGRGEGGEQA